jgi:hypothetical protein
MKDSIGKAKYSKHSFTVSLCHCQSDASVQDLLLLHCSVMLTDLCALSLVFVSAVTSRLVLLLGKPTVQLTSDAYSIGPDSSAHCTWGHLKASKFIIYCHMFTVDKHKPRHQASLTTAGA